MGVIFGNVWDSPTFAFFVLFAFLLINQLEHYLFLYSDFQKAIDNLLISSPWLKMEYLLSNTKLSASH